MVKISIIVPCYNAEKYIEKSINSLCNQTINDIEIIAIDDGSCDNTPQLLDKLAQKYNFLQVIHKKNEGVSIARNTGIQNANGEYIGFLDCDDWVEKDCYEKLYNKAKENDYDIVAFDTNAVYPNYNMYISSNISDNTSPQLLMLDAYAVIWNKIYKKSLLDNIQFNPKLTFCEDVLFLYMVYSKVKKVGAIHQPLHYYLQREGSLTYTYDSKLYQLIDALDATIDYYKKENLFDLYKPELEYSYIRYLYGTFMKRLAKTKDKSKYFEGYNFVVNKVHSTFPSYKSNKYLQTLKPKNIYLKYFNLLLAKIIFIKEKNKMN